MPTSSLAKATNFFSSNSFSSDFFKPLIDLVSDAHHSRKCPKVPDEHWVTLCVRRALELCDSGRAFLQQLSAAHLHGPSRSLYFENLKSLRRCSLVEEVSNRLARSMDARPSMLGLAEADLKQFDVFAGDGHYHAAAAHDPRRGSAMKKYPVGHFFTLNLRTQALTHLTVADEIERKHEHDMRALKRLDLKVIRQGSPAGRKVIYVWDRAGIDFGYWQQLKSKGIYFVSREKENMSLQIVANLPYDIKAPVNKGVLSDDLVGTSHHIAFRRVRYRCPTTQREFSFLTNEITVNPGTIAKLYQMRWNIEKTFDELKNKLHEGKAWATSPEAKTIQAHSLCLAHNLMILCERNLEALGIINSAEIKRREKRKRSAPGRDPATPEAFSEPTEPVFIAALQNLTVRSVKFIRWLRFQLFSSHHQQPNLNVLRRLFSSL